GLGEMITRQVTAKHIVMALKQGMSPRQAAQRALHELLQRLDGTAGALVMAPDGRFAIRHTTPWMPAGHWAGRGKPIVVPRSS
ncbi:MAG: hypothetical protein D6704_08975, partial [Nitrospirae bacterium]